MIHRRGFMHRDIKPANLLLVSDAAGNERLKLADLGLARSLATHSRAMTVGAGTLAYMAPEVASGSCEYGRALGYAFAVCVRAAPIAPHAYSHACVRRCAPRVYQPPASG